MRKFFLSSCNQFILIFFFASFTLISCKKQAIDTIIINKTQQVSITDIKNWADTLLTKLVDPPQLEYDFGQKATVNGRYYVRIPTYGASSEGGYFYFTKLPNGKLQGLYGLTNQKDDTKLDGMVGFADFDNNTYTIASYQNNKPVALYGLIDAITIFNNAFLNKQNATIVKKATSCNIGCPTVNPQPTFWQILGNFFSGIGGAISTAFNTLFGWLSDSGDSSGYNGGISFSTGGYSNWALSDFIGNYVNNAGPYQIAWSSTSVNAASLITYSPETPITNIMEEMKCFNNLAPATLTIYVAQPTAGIRDAYSVGTNFVNVGHSFIYLSQNNANGQIITRTLGFYPNGSGNPITPSKPSILGNDGGHKYNVSYTITLSSGQFNGIYGYIMDYQKVNGGNYNLNSYNCTNFAYDIAVLAGLTLPKTIGFWPLGSGMDPGDFGVDFLKQYPSTNGGNFARLITSGANAPLDSGTCN